jgi:hypothetical protein
MITYDLTFAIQSLVIKIFILILESCIIVLYHNLALGCKKALSYDMFEKLLLMKYYANSRALDSQFYLILFFFFIILNNEMFILK